MTCTCRMARSAARRKLVECFDATLHGAWKALLRDNSRGAGIYYTPNQTRLNGLRRNNEIMSRRACWFDWDHADKPLPYFPRRTVAEGQHVAGQVSAPVAGRRASYGP